MQFYFSLLNKAFFVLYLFFYFKNHSPYPPCLFARSSKENRYLTQDMFGYALRHPKLPARNGIVNAAGLTPLTLACQLGRAEVFREMLELSAQEFWRYSNITCSAYPLNALDTLLPDGRTSTS